MATMEQMFEQDSHRQFLEQAIRALNTKIAPVVLEEMTYPDSQVDGTLIRGKWGTLRFTFTLSRETIWQMRGNLRENMLFVMEQHTAKAVDGAIRSLVQNHLDTALAPMLKKLHECLGEVERMRQLPAQVSVDQEQSIAGLWAAVEQLQAPWYVRAWRFLNKPL